MTEIQKEGSKKLSKLYVFQKGTLAMSPFFVQIYVVTVLTFWNQTEVPASFECHHKYL